MIACGGDMRQGGMKPKSHSSGVYWVRANANNGKAQQQESSSSFGIVVLIVLSLPFLIVYLLFWQAIPWLWKKIRKTRG